MNRYSWIAPSYGYLVCLVAVITFLVNVSGFVDAMFERANPLRARGGFSGPGGESYTSFEAYRASINRERNPRADSARQPDTLATQELRSRYETLRADRIEQNKFDAAEKMVKNGLLILLAAVLFATHWIWLRRQREPDAAT